MKVILASGSKYRQMLLKQIGLPFEVHIPDVDEGPIKKLGLSAQVTAEKLARLKGEAVHQKFPQALIVAADQVAHLDQQILSKPGTAEQAVLDLHKLSGRAHELVTAVWMHHPIHGAQHTTVLAKMKMRPLSSEDIRAYVALDKPFDCAGSYKWEQAGISLMESVDCRDTSAIIGLPLIDIVGILKSWNLPLPPAWPRS